MKIGTRRSPLALWQAEWVAARLREEGADVELVEISTRGDRQQLAPVGAIGTRGVFTKEIQRALCEKSVDIAVHSLKDLPTEGVEGLCLAAVPERHSYHDVLVSREGRGLSELAPDALVGTGSLRRRAQLLHRRSDLRTTDVRGNVETRLAKLDEGQFDALILAEAGLRRLGLAQRITQVLGDDIMLPAVGQGALALECRSDDSHVRKALVRLEHPPTRAAVDAERSLLAALRGGCLAPIAALARPAEDGALHLAAVVCSTDGRQRLQALVSGPMADAISLGQQAAQALLADGAGDLIDQSRQSG